MQGLIGCHSIQASPNIPAHIDVHIATNDTSSHRNDSCKIDDETSDSKRNCTTKTMSSLQTGSTQFLMSGGTFQNVPGRPSTLVDVHQTHEHDIYGVGAQFSYMADSRTMTHLTPGFTCPYHGPILGGSPADGHEQDAHDPLQRYLTSGPADQHAIFSRPDTGLLSTDKGCKCSEMVEGNIMDFSCDEV